MQKLIERMEESERLWDRKLTGQGQYRPLVLWDWVVGGLLILTTLSVIVAGIVWPILLWLLR